MMQDQYFGQGGTYRMEPDGTRVLVEQTQSHLRDPEPEASQAPEPAAKASTRTAAAATDATTTAKSEA